MLSWLELWVRILLFFKLFNVILVECISCTPNSLIFHVLSGNKQFYNYFYIFKGAHKGFRFNEIPLSNRVVHGENANENQFPHQLSLQLNYGAGFFQHICGASIISSEWIITAGHCVTEVPPGTFRVKAGILNLSQSSGQTIDVDRFIVHPKYNGGVNPNDIALMKLAKPLELNEGVQIIRLASEDYTGESTISGWGSISTTNNPNYPDTLQTAKLNAISYQDCANALTKLFGTSYPMDKISNVCTLDSSNKGACSGDSGGPLTIGSGDNLRLLGVVSWGVVPCGYPGAPSVFTRVSSFRDFVTEHTGL